MMHTINHIETDDRQIFMSQLGKASWDVSMQHAFIVMNCITEYQELRHVEPYLTFKSGIFPCVTVCFNSAANFQDLTPIIFISITIWPWSSVSQSVCQPWHSRFWRVGAWDVRVRTLVSWSLQSKIASLCQSTITMNSGSHTEANFAVGQPNLAAVIVRLIKLSNSSLFSI